MPTVDFSDEEHSAVTAAVRRALADDRYPLSPRLAPLKSALAKLDPGSMPVAVAPKPPLPTGPGSSRGGQRARR